ncbi:MAG: asparagine synthase (glutamine-hydrolyzing) [Bacteroidia bacterium]|nr:asparagine synthase (glutamine-hydrolyzing) [Bacteroidia bacterium]MDW8015100.1 asparagine synthase (glutamine-hydrolyzing) [Bacteroidia bacterium]
MCGIAGYYLWRAVSLPALEQATVLLRHRGPDAARIWRSPDQRVGLAHTRLSILDLSEAAHQPFRLGPTWIVYNGEIYNFRELIQEGRFRPSTRSDTEVLLWAYQRWGEAFLQKLEGMFAFALYDEERQMLILARDPFGIKPLWVAVQPEGIFFASELKVLKRWLPSLRLRAEALKEFLHLGFIPAPLSFYEGIYKVLPGEKWCIHPRGYFQETYYDRQGLWQQPKLTTSPEEIEGQVERELRRAVRAHLVSDVPLGIFLSGGTDSSLVAAMAVAEGYTPQAFCIGFRDSLHNELPYAQAVAQHLGLSLEWEVLEGEEAAALLPEMSQWYDEPFGDTSALPTYLVSRLAARYVKVVLAGDGGDELYWGYGRYRWTHRLSRFKLLWRLSAPLFAYAPSPPHRRLKDLLRLPSEGIHEHIFSQEQYAFSWAEVEKLLPWQSRPWRTSYVLPSSLTESQAAWDFLHYLPDDLLTKVDRASMQHSLEVRVPLLDKKWAELAWRVPSKLKKPLDGSPVQYKPLLRRILRKYLPPALVERRKWGFGIPVGEWLSGPLSEWARTYADPGLLYQRYGFHPLRIRKLWERFERGDKHLGMRLWLLAQLGATQV